MKKALITGIAGQDGFYLAELLLAEGYAVFGMAKEGTDMLLVPAGVRILSGDLADADSLRRVVQESVPDEVYNLGGISVLKTADAFPELTWKVNYESVGILLDECLKINPSVRFLQASSSETFLPSEFPLNEDSPRVQQTENVYARAKMMADRDFIVRSRQEKGAFACSAFLFNHDSPRRAHKTVLGKISRGLVQIHLGKEKTLSIGNVEMSRDWSSALDCVQAMHAMLQQDVPEDFVIASGCLHSVRDAINIAAEFLGMELVWRGTGVDAAAYNRDDKKIVEVQAEFYRPTELHPKIGDCRKAEAVLGWKPKVDFRSLVELMVKANLSELGQ